MFKKQLFFLQCKRHCFTFVYTLTLGLVKACWTATCYNHTLWELWEMSIYSHEKIKVWGVNDTLITNEHGFHIKGLRKGLSNPSEVPRSKTETAERCKAASRTGHENRENSMK